MARSLRRRARLVSNAPPRSGLSAGRASCAVLLCLS